MNQLNLCMIVAMTKNRGIGFNGKIPWYHHLDLKRFRNLTGTSPVIMGRKTWDSLPKKPLKGRLNIVLTRNPNSFTMKCNGLYIVQSPEEAIRVANEYYETTIQKCTIRNVWVIGGQAIYETFIHSPLLKLIDCTIVPDKCECDTFFTTIPDKFHHLTITSTCLNPNPKTSSLINPKPQFLIHHTYSEDAIALS